MNIDLLSVGMQVNIGIMKTSLELPQKIRNRAIICPLFLLKSVALILEFLNFNITEPCVCVHVHTCACAVYKIPLAGLVVHTYEVGRDLEFEASLSY